MADSSSSVRAAGAIASRPAVPTRVTTTPAENEWPARSRACSTTLFRPGRSGTVHSTDCATTVALSPLQVTSARPDRASDAVPLTITWSADVTRPSAGAVSTTVGGARSMPTVTDVWALVARHVDRHARHELTCPCLRQHHRR